MGDGSSLNSGFVVCLLTLKQHCIIGRPKNTERQTDAGYSVFVLTGILDLDSGVRLGVGFVNHLSTDLLCQNLHTKKINSRQLNATATACILTTQNRLKDHRFMYFATVMRYASEPLPHNHLPRTECYRW